MSCRAAAVALLALFSACTRGGGREARARLEAPAAGRPAAFDWERPAAALSLSADEAARRLGSLDFAATATWSTSRGSAAPGAPGGDGLRVRMSEQHRLRQLASGDFQVLAELDPGTWPGAETGKEVVYAGGMTWARARYAPFRERPTDRGRDARRFRDDSFRLAADVLGLLGPRLAIEARGPASALGRPARRFALLLAKGEGAGAEAPAEAGAPARGQEEVDEDTRRRRDFLEGRIPLALDGELLLDADSGVPLQARLKATFGMKGDPRFRAEVELDARLTGWGDMVGAVTPPRGALADERKPRGVARALEQAGLRKRGEAAAEEQDEDAEGE